MADRMPYFDYTQPPEERVAKHHVWIQIFLLRYYLQNFQSAVALMDHCEQRVAVMDWPAKREPWEWMQIAARDAVMSVYHFGVVLLAIRNNVGKAPSLRVIDHRALKAAWKRFLDSFPLYEEHRHAVGHLADDMRTPEKLEALRPEDGPLISGTLQGRTYVMKYSKRDMRLAVTAATANELEEIMHGAWDAFKPVNPLAAAPVQPSGS